MTASSQENVPVVCTASRIVSAPRDGAPDPTAKTAAASSVRAKSFIASFVVGTFDGYIALRAAGRGNSDESFPRRVFFPLVKRVPPRSPGKKKRRLPGRDGE